MTPARMVTISKMMSKTLRHDPTRLGIHLDAAGWVDVDVLIAAFDRKGQKVTHADIEYVVEHNDKRRFTLDGDRIRAAQGHSIDIDLGLDPVEPPELLFHGTGTGSVESILASGLHPGSRQHVHLSADTETARKVGSRHGRPVVLTVLAGEMHRAGGVFYQSANGVWLAKEIPGDYIRR